MPINTLLAAGFLLLGLVSVGTGAEPVKTTVGLSDLQPAAQKAVQDKAAGARLGKIVRQTEDGENTYDVDITGARGNTTLTFDSKAALVSRTETVDLADIPAPVQKALRSHLADSKLLSLDKTTEGSKITYDAEFLKAGKRQSLTFGPDGTLIPEAGKEGHSSTK